MRASLLSAALGALLASACGEIPLDGVWANFPVPGSSTIMTLVQHDTLVTGTGTWSGEACCSGTLTVAGSYHPPRVVLTLTYDRGWIAHFTGALVDSRHLSGTETYDGGVPAPVTFTKR